MTTLFLDGLLVATIFFLGLGFLATRGSAGPEGPVGAWLLAIFPLLLTGAFCFFATGLGRFDWTGLSRTLQFGLSLGIPIVLTWAMFLPLQNNSFLPSAASLAIEAVVLAACVLTTHGHLITGPERSRFVMAVLSAAALTGWGLVGVWTTQFAASQIQTARQQADTLRQEEGAREAEAVAGYRALGPNATLGQLLKYVWTSNENVRQEALARVLAWPGLEDEVIRILQDPMDEHRDTVARFVAFVYERPSAKLAPAWSALLDARFPEWDYRLRYDDDPGKWDPNIRYLFEGAQKIQQAGGDLRPALRRWHDLLKGRKGLEGLTRLVAAML